LLFRLGPDRQPLFKEFAAAIRPTEFTPGRFFGTGRIPPIDYCVELAEGRTTPPANLDIATIQEQELAMMFGFHINQYLSRRAADWRERGFTDTLTDFAALNVHGQQRA
jgi:amidase